MKHSERRNFELANINLREGVEKLAWTRSASALLLAFLYLIVAAAAFNGFYDKWNFRDDDDKFSFVAMVEGTAHRPYVYRQLLPQIANFSEEILPERARVWWNDALYTADGRLKSGISSAVAQDPKYALRYHIIYYVSAAFLFLSLFVLRSLCLDAGFGSVPSLLAPIIMALLLPVFQTIGGYFYDMPELFFMSAAMWLAVRGKVFWIALLVVPAVWNKEAFLFFLICLYPFLKERFGSRGSVVVIGLLVFEAGLVYLAVRYPYSDNPGGAAYFMLLHALDYYVRPASWVAREITYGFKMLKGFSVVSVICVLIISIRGWPLLSRRVVAHLKIAALINVPLFVLLCGPGEVRNLSMLYVGFVLLVAANVAGLVRTSDPQNSSEGPPKL